MHGIQIGSFTLPGTLIVFAVSMTIALLVGRKIAGKVAAAFENKFWQTFWVGLIAARIGFVLKYWESYFASPLDIIDIRDGGWHAFAGFGVAFLYALMQIAKSHAIKKPLAAALVASFSIFLLGSFLLSMPVEKDVQLTETPVLTLQGGATSLKAFAGKPTVVNVWASWCPPCIREMPLLSKAQQQYPDIHFVFLNQGEAAETVQKFLSARNLTLENVLLDPQGAIAKQYEARGLPTTLFFDATGRLIDKRMGELSHATLMDRLSAIPLSSMENFRQ